MAEQEPSSNDASSTEKRIKQRISVPFCWEERPGTPIKNWKPTSTTTPQLPPPTKFIASIPFQWEEKPGTPLPCFLEPIPNSIPYVFHVSSSPTMNPFLNDTNSSVDDEILSESESDDSFNTANSLLGNGLISSVTLSSDVPIEYMLNENLEEISMDNSSVSEIESNYAVTGSTNLAGASLLEWLFPLLTPRSETVVSNIQVKNQNLDLENGKKGAVSMKKTLMTLEELIMMSRRQSFHRKAIKMQRQNLSKGGANWKGFGCCFFRTSKILGKIHMDWKRQLQLKLM